MRGAGCTTRRSGFRGRVQRAGLVGTALARKRQHRSAPVPRRVPSQAVPRSTNDGLLLQSAEASYRDPDPDASACREYWRRRRTNLHHHLSPRLGIRVIAGDVGLLAVRQPSTTRHQRNNMTYLRQLMFPIFISQRLCAITSIAVLATVHQSHDIRYTNGRRNTPGPIPFLLLCHLHLHPMRYDAQLGATFRVPSRVSALTFPAKYEKTHKIRSIFVPDVARVALFLECASDTEGETRKRETYQRGDITRLLVLVGVLRLGENQSHSTSTSLATHWCMSLHIRAVIPRGFALALALVLVLAHINGDVRGAGDGFP